jgi:HD superfamily phosphodiesterase
MIQYQWKTAMDFLTLNFYPLVNAHYPGLVGKIKKAIEDSEKEFRGRDDKGTESFLWEHTVLVTSLAFKLSKSDGRDPLLPVVTALFHDAGKFSSGQYRQDEIPEEEESAKLAQAFLSEAGAGPLEIKNVIDSLTGLYNERAQSSRAADIVHDADFLSKFGFLGAANFFIKSTLRGRTLKNAIMNSLSKELTYATLLSLNMRTQSGKKLAEKKSRDSLNFFQGLLQELEEHQGIRFFVAKEQVSFPEKDRIEVRLVLPETCETCGGGWQKDFETEIGIKCEKLNVRIHCCQCSRSYSISFCLPEIPGLER